MEDVEAEYASHLGCPGFCVLVRALDVATVSSVTLGSAASRWRRYEDTLHRDLSMLCSGP